MMAWHAILSRLGLGTAALLLVATTVQAQTLESYQQSLDAYRLSYETYQIKKNEFIQFSTYTAEEELIAAAKMMLLTRADVWISYWTMATQMVSTIPALESQTKDGLVEFYSTELSWLTTHKQTLQELTRRDALLEEAKHLNDKVSTYEAVSSQTTALVYAGRLHHTSTVLLKLTAATQERVSQQSLSETEKSLKLRGLEVTKERLEAVVERLRTYEQEHIQNFTTQTDTMEIIQRELEDEYRELRQQRSVLAELAERVEW